MTNLFQYNKNKMNCGYNQNKRNWFYEYVSGVFLGERKLPFVKSK
jgi:hypothetical protein